jgi:hypothetical protein
MTLATFYCEVCDVLTEDRRSEPPRPTLPHWNRCSGCGEYSCSDPRMYAIIREAETRGRNRTLLEKQAIAKEAGQRIASLPGFGCEHEEGLSAMVLESFLLVGLGWRHGIDP